MLKTPRSVVVLLVIACFDSVTLGQSQEPPKAPQVEPQQRPESGLKSQENRNQQNAPTTQPLPGVPEVSAESADRKGQSKSEEGSEQGTEFWPPLYGYRLKVTDTLLAGITFLLFLATFALWLATRKLVRSAEKTAKQQLRAYIGVSLRRATEFNVGAVPKAIFDYKNFGKTPARDVRHWANMTIEPHPSTPRFEPKPLDPALITVNPVQNENIVIFFGRTLAQNDIDAIRGDTARIYAYGEFWYFDIFGNEWRTEFRMMSGGPSMIEIQGMIRCSEGNTST
jgi:hypothetical protein